ncbi:MAG: polysaccharide biosynthesis protein [Candidatus Diapherotrites archaeon CG10_big_fil_rev_8_21_14_0_10_31_34]|nr:MAG: polysaccharide biosynthesis protein [Candidatus Diapherotrites archaeon CG10_big_fil_rev_8_21_14_0_10_31_34]
MKICVACSAGGHLSEIKQIEEYYKKHSHFFITFKRLDSNELAKQNKVFFVVDPKRNPFDLIHNFIQTFFILIKEKPDAVISTGAGVALPALFISKLMGKKTVFIESFCRINSPSFSGKIAYKFVDLFLVQWKENLNFYPKAKFRGAVF